MFWVKHKEEYQHASNHQFDAQQIDGSHADGSFGAGAGAGAAAATAN
jgi:hypothetical protein